MPGGGKSTIGRHLARRLGVAFHDTDAAIEKRIDGSIRAFFESAGEDRFREIEADVLDELLSDGGGVIATGGGATLRAANREALRSRSLCIYLRSSPQELMRRLRHDLKRPLLQVADPLGRLREMHRERDPLYQETAQFVIETGRGSVPVLVNILLMQLELAGHVDPFGGPASFAAEPAPQRG
jgi:shikimate kinase